MFLRILKKKFYFVLPNLYNNFYINKFFIEIKNSNPDYFYDDYILSQAYGTIPYSIWGINNTRKYVPIKIVKQAFDFYYQNKLSVNLLFENNFIEKEHLADTYSNMVLDMAHRKGNYITLASDILENYIRKNFPKYEIIKIVNKNGLNRKNILIDGRLNNNIESEPIKYKKHAYILLNPICGSDCKLYDYHREFIAKEQMNYNENGLFICPLYAYISFYPSCTDNIDFISLSRLKKLRDKGFRNFVINNAIINRSINKNYTNIDLIESYIYYLIKPEYQDIIRKKITYEHYNAVRRKMYGKV